MGGIRISVKDVQFRKAQLPITLRFSEIPEKFDTDKLYIIEDLNDVEGIVYHMGTALKDGKYVTNGGRVLFVTVMADTFAETILPLVNAILKGDEQVVKAIKSQNLTLNVNGTKLAEATLDNYESVAIRRGKILFGK